MNRIPAKFFFFRSAWLLNNFFLGFLSGDIGLLSGDIGLLGPALPYSSGGKMINIEIQGQLILHKKSCSGDFYLVG